MTNRQKPDSYFLSGELTLNLLWELDSLYILLFLTFFTCGKDLRIIFSNPLVLTARKGKCTRQPAPPQDHRAWTGAAVRSEFRDPASPARLLPLPDLSMFWSPPPFFISSMTFLFSLFILGLNHPKPCLRWGLHRLGGSVVVIILSFLAPFPSPLILLLLGKETLLWVD